MIVHESWNTSTSDNDIALLKLSSAVDLSTYTPACLPSLGDDFSGQNGTVYGWGTTQYAGTTSPVLLEVVQTIVSGSVCQASMDTSPLAGLTVGRSPQLSWLTS